MTAICEGRFGTIRRYISDTASQYVTADRPETSAAFSASHEVVTESPIIHIFDLQQQYPIPGEPLLRGGGKYWGNGKIR